MANQANKPLQNDQKQTGQAMPQKGSKDLNQKGQQSDVKTGIDKDYSKGNR